MYSTVQVGIYDKPFCNIQYFGRHFVNTEAAWLCSSFCAAFYICVESFEDYAKAFFTSVAILFHIL